MERRLEGKVALVTGSSRGIGRSIAARLAAEGAVVAVHYATRRDDALRVAGEIRSSGGAAVVVGGDVTELSEVERLFDEIEQQAGPVDVLVNNAGIHRGGRIGKLSPDDFDIVIRTSLHGAFHCMRRAVPGMAERSWGRVINVSSVVALSGSPGDAAYGAAKSGLLGLTRCVAAELAQNGVTVNAVLPGSGLDRDDRCAVGRGTGADETVDPGGSRRRPGRGRGGGGLSRQPRSRLHHRRGSASRRGLSPVNLDQRVCQAMRGTTTDEGR